MAAKRDVVQRRGSNLLDARGNENGSMSPGDEEDLFRCDSGEHSRGDRGIATTRTAGFSSGELGDDWNGRNAGRRH